MNASVLRRMYLEIRDGIPEDKRLLFSDSIVKSLIGCWELLCGAYDTFLMFYPLGSEVDLLPLAAWLLKEGKAVFFPVTSKDEIVF